MPILADSVAIDTHSAASELPPPSLLAGRPLLGSILLERGLLAPDRLVEALAEGQATQRRLGDELVVAVADPAPVVVEELQARLPYTLRLVVTEPSLVQSAWDDLLHGR